MYDVVIVGAGASAAGAALGLKNQNVLVLDVGKRSLHHDSLCGNLFDLKKTDPLIAEKILGRKFESLNNISYPYLNPKLKAPLNRYITDGAAALSPIKQINCDVSFSMAFGGMANAWGAGVYRFLDFELSQFPIGYNDLEPSYNFLTKHIGINGKSDDLDAYLGCTADLQLPAPFSRITKKLYDRYQRNKKRFFEQDAKIGHLRQAILTEDLGKRKKLDFSNLEFYRPMISSIYNPAFSLQDLIDKGEISYRALILVERFEESTQGPVKVIGKDLNTGNREEFLAQKVILAAGPFNTSKIVLQSYNDFETKLPIQENAISYIPLFDPFSVGDPIEKHTVPASLGLVYGESTKNPTWVSIYGLSGPLRSEFIMDFPFSIRSNLLAAKYCPSAMMIAQVFYPGVNSQENWIQLNDEGSLTIRFGDFQRGQVERKLLKLFAKLGFYGHHSLCKFPAPGNSFHYACTLPMKARPGPYETNRNGLLFGTKNIYIGDSSNFSYLPAKNLTFSMMANAHRIASQIF